MTDKTSILVVDDDKDSRNGIAHILRKYNFNVITAGNAKEALESFEQERQELVLADMRMPGMNGIELLKRVKAIAPQAEVIIITAYGEVKSYLEAMNHGAFEYLNKPIKIKELIKVINKVVCQHNNKSTRWNTQYEHDRKLSRAI